jgi:hypothetical protein
MDTDQSDRYSTAAVLTPFSSKDAHLSAPRASWAPGDVSDDKETKQEARNNKFVYESADLTFRTSQFLWELMVHLLYPLFVWDAPIAHSFWPIQTNITYLYMLQLSSISNALFIFFASQSSYLQYSDVVIPVIFWVMHRTMVSVKYACYSASEYK